MFSLIIPTYNRSHLITQTLQSAFNQATPFDEIIVVDDGSTDETPSVLKQFESRIKVIRTENQGVQHARNTGVAAALHERVVFCDSDDLLDSDYLQVMSQWLDKHQEIDVTYCNFSTFGTRPWFSDRYFSAPEGYFDDSFLDAGFYINLPDLYIRSIRYPTMWVTGMTVSKEFYKKIGGFNPDLNKIVTEDWEFNLRAIDNGHVALCRRPLARVRFHDSNQSGSPIRLALGAATILKFALSHHKIAKEYSKEIEEHIENYSNQAFDAAFSAGDFRNATKALALPYFSKKDSKTQIKKRILSLPKLIRQPLWRLTQIER